MGGQAVIRLHSFKGFSFSLPLSVCGQPDHDDGAQSRDQERRHGRGRAAGGGGVRHAGHREVQHREGHRRLHQEGVRQEVQPDVALHRGAQLRELRDARDEALHLLLPRPGCDSSVQVWLGWTLSDKPTRASVVRILHPMLLSSGYAGICDDRIYKFIALLTCLDLYSISSYPGSITSLLTPPESQSLCNVDIFIL